MLGGGTNSIFGPGGGVDGVGSVIRNVQNGNILGASLEILTSCKSEISGIINT